MACVANAVWSYYIINGDAGEGVVCATRLTNARMHMGGGGPEDAGEGVVPGVVGSKVT